MQSLHIELTDIYPTQLVMIGSHEALGWWDPSKGCKLEWNGEFWRTPKPISFSCGAIADGQRSAIDYKFVRMIQGQCQWECGPNRVLELPPGATEFSVNAEFNGKGTVKIGSEDGSMSELHKLEASELAKWAQEERRTEKTEEVLRSQLTELQLEISRMREKISKAKEVKTETLADIVALEEAARQRRAEEEARAAQAARQKKAEEEARAAQVESETLADMIADLEAARERRAEEQARAAQAAKQRKAEEEATAAKAKMEALAEIAAAEEAARQRKAEEDAKAAQVQSEALAVVGPSAEVARERQAEEVAATAPEVTIETLDVAMEEVACFETSGGSKPEEEKRVTEAAKDSWEVDLQVEKVGVVKGDKIGLDEVQQDTLRELLVNELLDVVEGAQGLTSLDAPKVDTEAPWALECLASARHRWHYIGDDPKCDEAPEAPVVSEIISGEVPALLRELRRLQHGYDEEANAAAAAEAIALARQEEIGRVTRHCTEAQEEVCALRTSFASTEVALSMERLETADLRERVERLLVVMKQAEDNAATADSRANKLYDEVQQAHQATAEEVRARKVSVAKLNDELVLLAGDLDAMRNAYQAQVQRTQSVQAAADDLLEEVRELHSRGLAADAEASQERDVAYAELRAAQDQLSDKDQQMQAERQEVQRLRAELERQNGLRAELHQLQAGAQHASQERDAALMQLRSASQERDLAFAELRAAQDQLMGKDQQMQADSLEVQRLRCELEKQHGLRAEVLQLQAGVQHASQERDAALMQLRSAEKEPLASEADHGRTSRTLSKSSNSSFDDLHLPGGADVLNPSDAANDAVPYFMLAGNAEQSPHRPPPYLSSPHPPKQQLRVAPQLTEHEDSVHSSPSSSSSYHDGPDCMQMMDAEELALDWLLETSLATGMTVSVPDDLLAHLQKDIASGASMHWNRPTTSSSESGSSSEDRNEGGRIKRLGRVGKPPLLPERGSVPQRSRQRMYRPGMLGNNQGVLCQ